MCGMPTMPNSDLLSGIDDSFGVLHLRSSGDRSSANNQHGLEGFHPANRSTSGDSALGSGIDDSAETLLKLTGRHPAGLQNRYQRERRIPDLVLDRLARETPADKNKEDKKDIRQQLDTVEEETTYSGGEARQTQGKRTKMQQESTFYVPKLTCKSEKELYACLIKY